MPSIQMNTRLDSGVKAQGDAVLLRNGISSSQAVRLLWSYVAEHQALPSFMAPEGARDQKECGLRQGVERGLGLAVRIAEEHGMNLTATLDVDFEQLETSRYATMLEEYEGNHV